MSGDPQKVLVVGASGYLGALISAQLGSQGHCVMGWGRRKSAVSMFLEYGNIVYHTGDLVAEDTLRAMIDVRPDAVIYCASLNQSDSERHPEHALRVNVGPVSRLLEKLASTATNPTRFIYLSTAHVYERLAGSIDENSPTGPRSTYGLTHLMCEQLLQGYADVGLIQLNILRISNGYGPPLDLEQDCWTLAVNDFCRSAVVDQKIILRSDGLAERDFVFVGDILNAVTTLACSGQTTVDRVYNVGSGHTLSILDLAKTVAERYRAFSGKECHISVPNQGDTIERSGNTRQSNERLLYKSKISEVVVGREPTTLNQGMDKLFAFLSQEVR